MIKSMQSLLILDIIMFASIYFSIAKPIQGKSRLSVSADFSIFITQEGHKLTYSCFFMFIHVGLLQAIDKLHLAKHCEHQILVLTSRS